MKYTHRNYKGQYTAWAASRFGVAVLAGTIILSLAGWVERTNDPRCKGLFTPIACEDAFKITPPRVARAIEPTPTVEPVLASEDQQKEIEAYIKTVFGKDSDKAMRLLTDRKCHENMSLDPEAVNRNWIKGETGKYSSSDWGVFQINDKWQGFNHQSVKFLKNYKVNIEVAKQLFDESGGSFKLWTCGKVLGI